MSTPADYGMITPAGTDLIRDGAAAITTNAEKTAAALAAAKAWRGTAETPLALTRPLAASTETTTSRSVRIPFSVPVRAIEWRIVIRNANYRTNTTYAGAVTLRTLNIGHGARDTAGNLTSSFLEGGQRRIIVRDTEVDLGAGYSSPWVKDELRPGVDYLMTFGYQHAGIATHLGMGGGWWTAGNPMNAELTHDPTAAQVIRLPFDVSVELRTANDLPVDALFGDSIGAASNATYPVLEAPLHIAGRDSTRAARLYSFGGAAFGEWIGPNWGDPNSLKWQHVAQHGKADRAFIALGNNDIHGGVNLTTLKANFLSLLALVRERVSNNVIACTVTPRTAWTGTTKEAVRQAFNDWLHTYPEGVGVADTGRAVEDAAGTAPRPDFVVSDGIHFNSAGSRALADALQTSALVPVTTDTGTVTIPAGANISDGTVTVSREGQTVMLSFIGTIIAGTGTDNGVLQLPVGYRPDRGFWGFLYTSSGAVRSVYFGTNGNVQVFTTATGDRLRTASPVTFRTGDPRPAV